MVNLRNAHEAKKKRLNDILVELTTKREQIPDQIQQLEMARDQLTQKIGDIISLVNDDDPVAVLQEEESERSDYCDIQDSERKIREIKGQPRQVVRKSHDLIMLFFSLVFLVVMLYAPF